MVIRSFVIALICVLSSHLYSQNSLRANIYRSAGIATNEDVKVFDANYGAQLAYGFEWKEINWEVGIDVRVIDWGNQGGLFIGNRWVLLEKEKSSFSFDYRLHANIPFFYQNVLLGYGLSSNLTYDVHMFRSYEFIVGIGLRFDSVPGYKNVGPIFSTFELPVSVGVKKRLGGKSNE